MRSALLAVAVRPGAGQPPAASPAGAEAATEAVSAQNAVNTTAVTKTANVPVLILIFSSPRVKRYRPLRPQPDPILPARLPLLNIPPKACQ